MCGGIEAGKLFVGLGLTFVASDDFSSYPAPSLFVHQLFECDAHALRAAGHEAVCDQPVEVGNELVIETCNHLRHAFSIAIWDAIVQAVSNVKLGCCAAADLTAPAVAVSDTR